MRFTASTNYNQFLPCPGLNWSRYGIVLSKRPGYWLWQAWLPIMASTVKNGIACLRKGNRHCRLMRTATFQPSTRPQDFWDLTSFFQSFSTLGSTFLQTHCKSSLQVCNIHNLKSCSEFLANPTTSASKPLYYRLFRQIQRRTSTESSSCEIRQRSSGIR